MTAPTKDDVEVGTGIHAGEIMNKKQNDRDKGNNIWCYATLDQVTSNLAKEFQSFDHIKFIKGAGEIHY